MMEKEKVKAVILEKIKKIEQSNILLDDLISILKSNKNVDWKWFKKIYNNFIKPIVSKCKILGNLIKENEVKTRSPKNDLINEKLDLILNGVHSLDARVAKVEVDMAVVKDDMVEVKGDINVLKTDMETVKDDMVEVKGDINVLKTDMEVVKSSINRLEKGFDNLKSHFGIDFLKNK